MGVKDLWQILAPVCERKSLWELQDKTIAIDLSGWVCDSQNVAEYSSQPNMYLRNLFFRTSCLLLLGARPVFVLEGDAPDLKLNVMSQRNSVRGYKKSSKNSGKRLRYKGIQKKCEEMLKAMGVHCVQSTGEAEALCALLNAEGIVDGCISQDSDCFLYGGQVVYRNFTISASSGGGGGAGFSIDMYRMQQVEELLGLSRTKLIGMSLLCGCDYNQGGVSGVGKETAVKFLATLEDEEVFPRFFSWRNDPKYEQLEKERSHGVCDRCCHLGKKRVHDKSGCDLCGTSKSCHVKNYPHTFVHRSHDEQKLIVNELNIRKKALQGENFPSQDLIDEFSCKMEVPDYIPSKWTQPNLIGFMKLAEKYLKWDECYCLEKFLPLLTRWVILHRKTSAKCPIYPEAILKTRVLKGVASYEVKWTDKEGLFETLVTEEDTVVNLTIEPIELFNQAFPELVKHFLAKEAEKKVAKRKGPKTSKKVIAPTVLANCSKCGRGLPSKNQSCMCHFIKPLSDGKVDKLSTPTTLDSLLNSLSINSVLSMEEKQEPPKVRDKSSKVTGNCERLKELLQSSVPDTPWTADASGLNGEDQLTTRTYSGFSLSSNSASVVVKDCPKFSFENLLEDTWTVDDFAKEEEGDLSDIVQSITGKSTKPQGDCKVEGSSSLVQRMNSSELIPEGSGSSSGYSPIKPKKENSFDDEIPYTPLIDRVRKMRSTQIQDGRSCAAASLKLRRFSESFDVFCVRDNETLYPLASTPSSSSADPGASSDITFSLGISNLLENSK